MGHFDAGALAAFKAFRAQLIEDRENIENEDEPVFDVIVDLLDKLIDVLKPYNEMPVR